MGPRRIYSLEQRDLGALTGAAQWFKLPAYQRGYVWSPAQAVALVETIMMMMPIGSCILRETPNGALVIDGQQRISTLIGMSMGNGGEVPEVCVEYDPTAADDPIRAGGAHVKVVIGSGPGRVPVRMLGDIDSGWLAMYALAAAGEDVSKLKNWRHGYTVDHNESAFRAFSSAEDAIRFASMPALVFNRHATDAQVKDAFRRINLGGAPIAPDALERLLAHG